jgi:DNA-binding XRE family transcriptional regulator
MQRLVDGFDDPAYVVRGDAELTLESWNHAAERRTGYAAEDTIGQPAYERLRPTVDRATRAQLEADLRERHWWVGTTTLLDRRDRPITSWGVCYPVWRDEPDDSPPHYLTVLVNGDVAGEFFPLLATSTATQGSAAAFMASHDEWHFPGPMDEETPRQRRRRTIGENIIRYREIKHLSRYALARDLRVDRSQLIKWETGTWEPSADHIAQIAERLGVPEWTFYVPQERVA